MTLMNTTPSNSDSPSSDVARPASASPGAPDGASLETPDPMLPGPILGLGRICVLVVGLIIAIIFYFFVDRPVTLDFYDRFPAGSAFAEFCSRVTDLGLSTYYLVILGISSIVSFLFVDKVAWLKREELPGSPKHPLAFFFYRLQRSPVAIRLLLPLICISGSGLVCVILKVIAGRYRPSLLTEQGQFGFSFMGFHYSDTSMPSGHASTCAAILIILWIHFPRVWALWIPLTVLAACTRVVTQSHYPSDVVVGYTIGLVFASIVYDLARRHHWPTKPELKI